MRHARLAPAGATAGTRVATAAAPAGAGELTCPNSWGSRPRLYAVVPPGLRKDVGNDKGNALGTDVRSNVLAEGHIQTMLVVRVRVMMAFGQRRTFLVPDSWGDALVVTHKSG